MLQGLGSFYGLMQCKGTSDSACEKCTSYGSHLSKPFLSSRMTPVVLEPFKSVMVAFTDGVSTTCLVEWSVTWIVLTMTQNTVVCTWQGSLVLSLKELGEPCLLFVVFCE